MTRRSIFWMVVRYVVTLGTYRLYWLAKTRSEMKAVKPKLKIASPLLVIIPVLLMALSIGSVIKTSQDAKDRCLIDQANGTALTVTSCNDPKVNEPADWAVIVFYISCGVFIPLQAIFFWGYSRAVSDITKDKISFPLAMLLLILLPYGFDIMLIQEAFNETKLKKKPAKKTPVTAAA